MQDYEPQTYGELIAGKYDELYPDVDSSLIETLAELASGGRALELGSGTGRVAVPLTRKGVEVHGIDASEKMTARMKEKPGGEAIPVTQSSIADFDLEIHFNLVYVVFNTFFALLTQAEQISCMRAAARHLKPGGVFLIEAFVPDLTRFDRGQRVSVVAMDQEYVRIDASMLDRSDQTVTSQHVLLTSRGVEMYPVKLRFAYPSELDLMAQVAGLSLEQRWSSWNRESFDSQSDLHVSMYRKN